MKKSSRNLLLFFFIIAIAGIIIVIMSLKSNGASEEAMSCIAKQAKLYISKTCSHCAEQKKILGDYFSLFDTIDCIDEPKKCIEADILYIPTWIINNETYTGVQSIKNLRQITGC